MEVAEQKMSAEVNKQPENRPGMFRRREILKNLATLPVFGIFFLTLMEKRDAKAQRKAKILKRLGLSEAEVDKGTPAVIGVQGDLIRLGIIGIGTRGEQLGQALGYGHPDWINGLSKNRLEDWLAQEDLKVAITGVCDVFDQRAERGVEISECALRPARIRAKRYRNHREMMESPDIDAVLIATPDFHHAPMTIAASQAGKHVYCEKCMTRTEQEVFEVAGAVRNSGVVFQLGHQNHQSGAYRKAREVIKKNVLGKVTLVESTSNRNRHKPMLRRIP